jgi:hypothetical protein
MFLGGETINIDRQIGEVAYDRIATALELTLLKLKPADRGGHKWYLEINVTMSSHHLAGAAP